MTKNNYIIAKAEAEKNYAKLKRLTESYKLMPESLVSEENLLLKEIAKFCGTPLEKLDKLYRFMDVIYSYYGPFIPCKKGCSYCCYIEVSVSPLEAEYIERMRGIRGTFDRSEMQLHGTPCPFLNDNLCSIYYHRPFVCRQHTALFRDPKWCHLDVAHSDTFPRLRFSGIYESYRYIITKAQAVAFYDIRQLFQNISSTR